MTFADHFSVQAADYAKYRPGYPRELFEWLRTSTPRHTLAWDVGTGNGQAALQLADFFDRVTATDPSAAQLKHAVAHERVTYRVQAAEDCDLPDASVDLVTAAQALHWFDFERFYRQVRRVLRPSGVIAAWTYDLNEVDAGVDAIVRKYYTDIVGPYWPAERRYVETGYRALPFPFVEIPVPAMRMETSCTFADYLRYLGTWSATQRYREVRQQDPVALIAEELRCAWGGSAKRVICWPLRVRAGRVEASD